jgi:hypothetical protein
MGRYIFLVLSLALSLLPISQTAARAEEITAILHYTAGVPPATPILVSFGLPFPKKFIADANLIRVKNEAGTEIPAHVRVLVPWRDLSTGASLPSIRSALIQVNVNFGGAATLSLKVETGVPRTQNVATEQSVYSNWVLVDDAKYPAKWGVYEPPVYVTLPPIWLGRCAVKALVTPCFSYPDFNWYDDPLTNSDPNKNFGQNFFRTAINDDPLVIPAEQIWYLERNPYLAPGEDDASPYEPWLYDRAMTMFVIYLRSGNVSILREAHRGAYFYASQLNSEGFFTLKPYEEGYDVKYSYNESLFTDLLLLGDEGHLNHINNVTTAAATFNYVYSGDQGYERLWTERNLAFTWLAFIVAFEATGNSTYADQARQRADYIFQHQNNPPLNAEHGRAPNDGALMHGFDSHEGWWEPGNPFWIFSPWMTTLLVDVMQRYHLHSGDQRMLASAQRFGDAIINFADVVRGNLPGWEGYEFPDVPIPSYLAGSQGSTMEWEDYNHCLDVAKITAFAYYCSVLQGTPQTKYHRETARLLEGAGQVIAYWIRPQAHDYGKSIYRLSPARKFNWWFRTTSDLDYLVNCGKASITPIYLLLF